MSLCHLSSIKRSIMMSALRYCVALCSLSAALCSLSAVYAEAPTSHEEIYKEVYLVAESLVKQDRLREAISVYKGALRELHQDGKVHLRLAQLHQQLKDPKFDAWVAHHYLMCTHDTNLDHLIREQICVREVKKRFSPLLIAGTPSSLELLAPEPFQGPVNPSMMLPNGKVVLRFMRRGANQPEVLELTLPMQAVVNLGPRSFMPSRPKLSASELLVNAPPQPAVGAPPAQPQDPFSQTELVTPASAQSFNLPRWPAYLLFVLSAAGAGVGAYTYLNIDDFTENYLGKELPVVLWGSAGAMAVLGGGWLAISW